jgi:hypothetical protein
MLDSTCAHTPEALLRSAASPFHYLQLLPSAALAELVGLEQFSQLLLWTAEAGAHHPWGEVKMRIRKSA